MLAVVIAEGVAVLLLGVLVLGLLRSHALILKALHELGAGLELEKDAQSATPAAVSAPAEPVALELETGVVAGTRPSTSRARDLIGSSLDGQARGVGVGEGRHLLAFLSSGCTVCQTFWEEFARGPQDVPGGADLVVICKGPEEESASTLRRLAGRDLPVLQSSAAWDVYGIPGSPYFIYVEQGVITGEGSATTWPQVRDLMSQAVADTAEARLAAGRTGPGAVGIDAGEISAGEIDAGEIDAGEIGAGEIGAGDLALAPGEHRDSLPRMDRELLGAGIYPGHPSLYEPADPPGAIDHPGIDHDHPPAR